MTRYKKFYYLLHSLFFCYLYFEFIYASCDKKSLCLFIIVSLSFSTPSYASLTSTNSSMLPACFVLKLGKKMPICMELVKRIQKVTELECGDISAPHPLLSLIIQHVSDGQLDCRNNKGLYVVNDKILKMSLYNPVTHRATLACRPCQISSIAIS